MIQDIYKVYVLNVPVIISQSIEKSNEFKIISDYNINDKNFYSKLKSLIKTNKNKTIFFEGDNSLIYKFESHFKIHKAGGGLVINNLKKILMIKRNGVWDLPKGHLEIGESIEDCAIREVKEETGISELTIEKFIGITRHIYTEKGKDIIKESHWFLMNTNSEENLKPQFEEGIEKAVWVDLDKVSDYYDNAWPSVVEVLKVLE